MSRNNQIALTPICSSSSSSDLESPLSIQQNFYTFNVTINYSSTAPSQTPEQPLAAISNLIGQQIKDVNNKKRRSSRWRSSSTRRSMRPSKELTYGQEVDALPIVSEQQPLPDDITQEEKDEIISSSSKKSKYSREYQDLSSLQKPKIRYRLVPSKNVKPVPEDQLPKKKFSSDQKRREYVVLGRLNSLEPLGDEDEERKKEERKRRSRELARELY